MLIEDIKRKQKINFSTLSPEVLPPVNNGKVVEIVGMDRALEEEPNLLAMNTAISANANIATLSIHEDDFFIIYLKTGKKVVVASSWIVENSIEINSGRITVSITLTDITMDDLNFYRSTMESRGHSYVVVTQ